ncbi:MAG: hypothetical protein KKE11_01405, partial [Gammaproteobacteria bacterium]|nr:hypothetical protein [Gammaproteobacteria bacterium]
MYRAAGLLAFAGKKLGSPIYYAVSDWISPKQYSDNIVTDSLYDKGSLFANQMRQIIAFPLTVNQTEVSSPAASNRTLTDTAPSHTSTESTVALEVDDGTDDNASSSENEIWANPEYQYDAEDINNILMLRLQQSNLDIRNIFVAEAIDLNTESLQDRLNSIRTLALNHRNILIPIFLATGSWAGIVVNLNEADNHTVNSIYYLDSTGNSIHGAWVNGIRSALRSVYGENVDLRNSHTLLNGNLSTNLYTSGPLVIENFIRLLTGTGETPGRVLSNQEIRRIRKLHINLLERHRPYLDFRSKQQNGANPNSDINLEESDVGVSRIQVPHNFDFIDQFPNWEMLPDELWQMILENLPNEDLNNAGDVNSAFKRNANDDLLWAKKSEKDFTPETLEKAKKIYLDIIADKNATKLSDFKFIYGVCWSLQYYGEDFTKDLLLKKTNALIEINANTDLSRLQKFIADITAPNSRVRALVIDGTKINFDQAKQIFDALKNKNSNIKFLTVRNYQIGNDLIQLLGRSLSNGDSKVEELNLVNISMSPIGAQAIASALLVSKIKKLNISDNNIGEDGARLIAKVVEESSVSELNISHNNIGDNGVGQIAAALPKSGIVVLNISGNNIGPDGVKVIVNAIQKENSVFSELNISDNELGAAGAEDIGNILPKITSLNIARTNIGPDGARFIAQGLQNSSVTRELDISGNQINAAGAGDISNTMANLNRLNIADNAIGDQGAEFISVSLPNSNIRALKIAKNSIENEGANALTMAVRKSKVADLDISNNRISDAAKKGFSETIWDLNCRLVKLNIASNLLSPNGLLYILEGLKNINGKIAILDISDNTLTGKIKDLFAILKHPHCKVSDITMKNCVPNFEDFRQLFEFYSHGFVTDLKAQITTDTDNYGKTFAKMISQASSGEITELRFLSFPNNLTGELNVTKESIKLLIETLKSNTCNIDTIELSNITSSDDTSHELSELIKDPSCKITQISLIGAYLNTDELYETAYSINNSLNSRRKITIEGI